jgi:hypothetical protein
VDGVGAEGPWELCHRPAPAHLGVTPRLLGPLRCNASLSRPVLQPRRGPGCQAAHAPGRGRVPARPILAAPHPPHTLPLPAPPGLALNATLVGQILIYGNRGVAKAPAGAAAKAKKKA